MKTMTEESLELLSGLDLDKQVLCLAQHNGGTVIVSEATDILRPHWQGIDPENLDVQISFCLTHKLQPYFKRSVTGVYHFMVRTPEGGPVPSTDSPYTHKLYELVEQLSQTISERGFKYGDNWKDEGPDGLMYNILRKVRRLWKTMMMDGRIPDIDDGVDLAGYGLMIIALTQLSPSVVGNMKARATHGLFEEVLPTDEHNGRDE